jgi:hypothetical protein
MTLVNSVRWTFTGAASGRLCGELWAPDRLDVPGRGALKFVSLHVFSGVSGFSACALSLRYDHVAAAALRIPEAALRLFQWAGAEWKDLNAAVDTDLKSITATGLDALGIFAVGRVSYQSGALVTVY